MNMYDKIKQLWLVNKRILGIFFIYITLLGCQQKCKLFYYSDERLVNFQPHFKTFQLQDHSDQKQHKMVLSKDSAKTRECSCVGEWKEKLSYFEPKSEEHNCRTFLQMLLKNHPRSIWLFLGDSTMKRTADSYLRMNRPCKVLKRCKTSCEFIEYLELPTGHMIHNSSREVCGKEVFIRSINFTEYQIKQRTGGCLSQSYACKTRRIEYLPIYMDVSLKLPNRTERDHEALYSYLSEYPKDVCVANVGLHPMKTNRTTDQYTNNIRIYLQHLQLYCKQLIWMASNSVLGQVQFKQNNTLIQIWNKAIENLIVDEFSDAVYIDIFPMSLQSSMHLDNVHLNREYHDAVARLLFV